MGNYGKYAEEYTTKVSSLEHKYEREEYKAAASLLDALAEDGTKRTLQDAMLILDCAKTGRPA